MTEVKLTFSFEDFWERPHPYWVNSEGLVDMFMQMTCKELCSVFVNTSLFHFCFGGDWLFFFGLPSVFQVKSSCSICKSGWHKLATWTVYNMHRDTVVVKSLHTLVNNMYIMAVSSFSWSTYFLKQSWRLVLLWIYYGSSEMNGTKSTGSKICIQQC